MSKLQLDYNRRRNNARDLVRKSNLPRPCKDVARIILDYASAPCKFEVAWPSIKTIADDAEYSERQTKRAIKVLLQLGLFVVHDELETRQDGVDYIRHHYDGYDISKANGRYRLSAHRHNIYITNWRHAFWAAKDGNKLSAATVEEARETLSGRSTQDHTGSVAASPESSVAATPNPFGEKPNSQACSSVSPCFAKKEGEAPTQHPSFGQSGQGGVGASPDQGGGMIPSENQLLTLLQQTEEQAIAYGGDSYKSKIPLERAALQLHPRLKDIAGQLTHRIIHQACGDREWLGLREPSIGNLVSDTNGRVDRFCERIRFYYQLSLEKPKQELTPEQKAAWNKQFED